MVITFKIEEPDRHDQARRPGHQATPLRQTDRRKSEEPEGWGWEQQPVTREENHHYRVSGLVQHWMCVNPSLEVTS